ncbi:MAG: hypothetical protein ACM3ZC_05730, partial [Bacteroidota bacterium]
RYWPVTSGQNTPTPTCGHFPLLFLPDFDVGRPKVTRRDHIRRRSHAVDCRRPHMNRCGPQTTSFITRLVMSFRTGESWLIFLKKFGDKLSFRALPRGANHYMPPIANPFANKGCWGDLGLGPSAPIET